MVRAIAPLWCANPLPMLTLLLQPLSEGKKLMTTDCFKTYLQEEFVRRCRNNKAYSLRSFARQLSINHSSLSRILSGKRALSENMIQKLAEQLELAPNEIEYFIFLFLFIRDLTSVVFPAPDGAEITNNFGQYFITSVYVFI